MACTAAISVHHDTFELKATCKACKNVLACASVTGLPQTSRCLNNRWVMHIFAKCHQYIRNVHVRIPPESSSKNFGGVHLSICCHTIHLYLWRAECNFRWNSGV